MTTILDVAMNALDRMEAALEKPANFLTNHTLTRNLQYGVMIRSDFGGKTHFHMDDVSKWTEAQARDEAMAMDTNDLLGMFSVDMATGEIQQIMNRADLVDYCEQRERDEMTDGERAEQREIDNHNFVHGTTL